MSCIHYESIIWNTLLLIQIFQTCFCTTYRRHQPEFYLVLDRNGNQWYRYQTVPPHEWICSTRCRKGRAGLVVSWDLIGQYEWVSPLGKSPVWQFTSAAVKTCVAHVNEAEEVEVLLESLMCFLFVVQLLLSLVPVLLLWRNQEFCLSFSHPITSNQPLVFFCLVNSGVNWARGYPSSQRTGASSKFVCKRWN